MRSINHCKPILHVCQVHFRGMLQKHWNLYVQLQKNTLSNSTSYFIHEQTCLKTAQCKEYDQFYWKLIPYIFPWKQYSVYQMLICLRWYYLVWYTISKPAFPSFVWSYLKTLVLLRKFSKLLIAKLIEKTSTVYLRARLVQVVLPVVLRLGMTGRIALEAPRRTKQQASEFPFCQPNWKRNECCKLATGRINSSTRKNAWRTHVYTTCMMSPRDPFRDLFGKKTEGLNGCLCLLNEKRFSQRELCLQCLEQASESLLLGEWHWVIAYLFTWGTTQWTVKNQFAPSDSRVSKVFVLRAALRTGHLENMLLLIEKKVNRYSLAILTII